MAKAGQGPRARAQGMGQGQGASGEKEGEPRCVLARRASCREVPPRQTEPGSDLQHARLAGTASLAALCPTEQGEPGRAAQEEGEDHGRAPHRVAHASVRKRDLVEFQRRAREWAQWRRAKAELQRRSGQEVVARPIVLLGDRRESDAQARLLLERRPLHQLVLDVAFSAQRRDPVVQLVHRSPPRPRQRACTGSSCAGSRLTSPHDMAQRNGSSCKRLGGDQPQCLCKVKRADQQPHDHPALHFRCLGRVARVGAVCVQYEMR